MTRRHAWTLGPLDLVGPEQMPGSGFWFHTLADGWDLGTASADRVIRPSLLGDGDDSYIERYGNRSIAFEVNVCGYTAADLSDGEKALVTQCGGKNLLIWTPPGSGPSSRYNVRTSTVRLVPGQDLEFIRNSAKSLTYEVTLDCAPWAESVNTFTETYTPGTATITTLDECTSATNWPGATAGTYLSESVVSYPAGTGDDVRRTVNMAAGTFAFIEMAVEDGFLTHDFYLSPSGVRALAVEARSNGFTRYFFVNPAGVPFRLIIPTINGSAAKVHVTKLGTSNVIPSGSMFGLSMLGSVRTRPNLRISGGSTNLQHVFVCSDTSWFENGWSPENEDSWEQAPDGTYMFWIKPVSTETYVEGDTFALTVNGETASTVVDWPLGAATYAVRRWFPIGPFHLGGRKSRRLGTLTISLTHDGDLVAGDNNLRMFREHEDSVVNYIPNLDEENLWFSPPSFEEMTPGVFAGTTEALATSVLGDFSSIGYPWALPGFTTLYVESSAVAAPVVTFTHRPPFHTFAAV